MIENKVITFSGKEANRKDCRKIKDEYYLVGDINKKDSGDCYKMEDGRYHRINNGYIVFHERLGKYVLKNNYPDLIVGVIGQRSATSFELGCFDLDLEICVPISNNIDTVLDYGRGAARLSGTTIKWCISKEVAENMGYSLANFDGVYYKPRTDSAKNLFDSGAISGKHPYMVDNTTVFNTEIYGAKGNMEFNRMINYHKNKKIRELTPFIKKIEKYIPYSVGIEFETSSGHLPISECFKNGLVPVKDGSINGHEYITIPWYDNKITRAYNAAKALTQANCSVRSDCSLHIHFGNVPNDRLYIVSLYMLCVRLQEEIFSMMPPYKRDIHYLAGKRGGPKDHCKPLNGLALRYADINNVSNPADFKEEVSRMYSTIFKFLNEGHNPDANYNRKNRTTVNTGRNKWNVDTRYYWVNLLGFIFGGTAEFRAHWGTVNPYRTVIWMLICSAILKYAESNQMKILRRHEKIFLEDVINFVYNDGSEEGKFLSDYIKNYIFIMTEKFTEDYMNKNIYSDVFETDSKFIYTFQNRSIFTE